MGFAMKAFLMNQCFAAGFCPPSDRVFSSGQAAATTPLRPFEVVARLLVVLALAFLVCVEQARAQSASASPSAQSPAADLPLLRLFVREQFFEGMTNACAKRYLAQSTAYAEQFNAWKLKHEATRQLAAKRYLLGTQQNDRASMNEALGVERAAIERWQMEDMKVPINRAPTQSECDRLVAGMGHACATWWIQSALTH
jgi:hypothetical protein